MLLFRANLGRIHRHGAILPDFRQAVVAIAERKAKQLFRQTVNKLMALPVAQRLIPADQSIGGQSTQQRLLFHQEHPRACAPGCQCRRHACNAAADYQYVRFLPNRGLQPFHQRFHPFLLSIHQKVMPEIPVNSICNSLKSSGFPALRAGFLLFSPTGAGSEIGFHQRIFRFSSQNGGFFSSQ